jgi:hypothetical protein
MKNHFKYLKYVLLHKWYVFLYGIKLGVPLWGLIIHDWQKFTPVEWYPYVMSFYGPWKYNERPDWLVDDFDLAWLHHQHYGPHHWQYWVLREDSGALKLLEMPDRYRREMLADWRGAGMAINGRDETKEFYLKNRGKIQLHLKTRLWVESELGIE